MNQKNIIKMEMLINESYGNIAGLIVQKNGTRLYEKYLNGHTAGDALPLYSATKSVISALVGIAVRSGCIESVNQKVLDFFPDYKVRAGEMIAQEITIRNLLTMTAPYRCKVEPYTEFFASENWVDFALDLLGGEVMTGEFFYSYIVGSHILSGVLAQATGQPVLAFAAEHLFTPLGIPTPSNVVLLDEEAHMAYHRKIKHERGWVVDPQGISTAGWGLALTPSDMAKIGQLYLDGGRWGGRQILPVEWIKDSVREQSRWGQLSYGYLWWLINSVEHSYAAMGDGGNEIYVNEKKKMVIVIASLFMPDAKDRMELILEHIEPIFEE